MPAVARVSMLEEARITPATYERYAVPDLVLALVEGGAIGSREVA
jgi:hypothetical protein